MFGQQIGFLKFQADVFDKQTGIKVHPLLNVQLHAPL